MNARQQQLVERFAEIHKAIGYSSVSGQVMGLFYTSDQKYFTFEEITETLNITKGTTSQALKFLVELGDVRFITKGDNKRKRYFYISEEGFLNSQYSWIEALKEFKLLLKDILSIRSESGEEINELVKKEIAYLQDVIPYHNERMQHYFEKNTENNKD